jgi:hypothetical protein
MNREPGSRESFFRLLRAAAPAIILRRHENNGPRFYQGIMLRPSGIGDLDWLKKLQDGNLKDTSDIIKKWVEDMKNQAQGGI